MMEPSRSTVDEGGKVGVGRAIGAGGDRVLREGIEEVLDFCKECVTKEKVLEYRAKSASLSLGHKVQMLSPIDMNGNIFEAPLYWDIYAGRGFDSSRICFSCHNFEYRGVASASELVSCGLNVHHVNRQDRLQDNSSHDRFLDAVCIEQLHAFFPKGAIVFSNIVTIVSPTYAQKVALLR